METEIKTDVMSEVRNDDWKNFFAGLGKRGDKTQSTRIGTSFLLEDDYLSAVYMSDGLGKKIITSVSEDLISNGYTVKGDTMGLLKQELRRLNDVSSICSAIKWTRLYGGGIIVMGFNDGSDLASPLRNKKARVTKLKVYPRSRLTFSSADISKMDLDEVERFTVQKTSGEQFTVHRDRCIVFQGDEAPYPCDLTSEQRYWGIPVLQSIYDQVKNMGAANQSLANIFMELVVGKYKFSNLGQLLASGKSDMIYKRMDVINASKSMINGVLLGEGEEYSRDSISMSGMGDVWDRFMIMISAVAEIPVTRLFGVSPNGLNPTDESSRKNYSDSLESKQQTWLYPMVQRLVTQVNLGVGLVPTDKAIEIKFLPVWKPTQKDLVDMNKTQADADKIYMELGVLSPDEVRACRFEGEQSYNTVLQETAGVDE